MTRSEASGILAMSLRNLSRHRAKTAVTVAAVAISVSMYIFVDGWIYGMNLDSRRNIVSYEMGAAKVQSDAYYAKKDDLPMYEAFSGWEEGARRLEAAGYAVAPRFVFIGTAHSSSGSAPVVVNAVDPDRESAVLRYPGYVEVGRFPRGGTMEMAVGSMLAERLHVGIPQRPTASEYERELLAAARDDGEAAFIESLYEPYRPETAKRRPFEDRAADGNAEDRLNLKSSATKEDLQRLWDILFASGRMGVRVSTTIDMKALPSRVGAVKADADLLPAFTDSERAAFLALYRLDADTADYALDESVAADPARSLEAETALSALLANDYAGAVRHVNQLIDAVVVGVVNSPNPKNNGNVATMSLIALSGETGMMLGTRVTELLVRARDADDSTLPGPRESASAIAAAGAFPSGVSVREWKAYSEDYFAASAGDQVSSRVMIAFLFVLSFLGIANTMLMAILERTREIGMLRALGMDDSRILLSYVVEASLVGCIGSLAGVAIGCAINVPMVRFGIDYSAMTNAMGGDIGYRIAASFRSAWNVPAIVGTFFASTILSGLVAIPPARRALRMPVTDSLRFE